MFDWFRNRRRRKILAEPFPKHWDVILLKSVALYSRISPAEQSRLRDVLRILIDEKYWEPARGFHITEEMKLVIAAQAALMLIGIPKHDYFSRVPSIVVHPGEFRRPDPEDDTIEDEVSDQIVDGIANYRGSVVVGWNQSREEALHPEHGFSVVIHEFAHQLDFMDESTDGTPPLSTQKELEEWARVMSSALERHRKAIDKGRKLFFSEQASDSETEFFSDACESFFCQPIDLREHEPDVYRLLKNYFGVDPVIWFET